MSKIILLKAHKDGLIKSLKRQLKREFGWECNSDKILKKKLRKGGTIKQTTFSDSDYLWARVLYFGDGTKDFHRTLKPLLDQLNKCVYVDDKQILFIKGYDLNSNNIAYEVSYDEKVDDSIFSAINEFYDSKNLSLSVCIIEIGKMPIKASGITLKWQLKGF